MEVEVKRSYLALIFPLGFLFIMYLITAFEAGSDMDLSFLGVHPRSLDGIMGVFTHPFVHGGWGHLYANTIPFLFLGWCLFYFYKDQAWAILGSIWLTTGVLLFFIGVSGWHIGASGVIYGLAFFLAINGLVTGNRRLSAISLLVIFLYGSIIWNMFPAFAKAGTSWEGHLSGAMSGVLYAFVFRKKRVVTQIEEEPEDENEQKPIHCRKANLDDASLIRSMAESTWKHTYREILSPEQANFMFEMMYAPTSILEQMELKNHVYYIAYKGDEACGYLSIDQLEEHLFHIHKLYIVPDFQQFGVGRFLIKQALLHIKQVQHEPAILQLNVNRNNSAVGFYERMGFQILKQVDVEIGNGYLMEDFVMQKKVEGQRD